MVLAPWISVGTASPHIRLEWILVVLGLLVTGIRADAVASKVGIAAFALASSYAASMMYASFVLGLHWDIADLFEFLKPALYFAFYLLASAYPIPVNRQVHALRILLWILLVSAAVCLVQYFNPTLIAPLLLYWVSDETLELYQMARATGTIGNPNDLGFLMSIGFGVALFTARHRPLGRGMSAVAVAAFLGGVLASGSRTALVCATLVAALFLVTETRWSVKRLTLICVSFVGLAILGLEAHDSEMFALTNRRIAELWEMDQASAWQQRVNSATDTLGHVVDSWLLGHGPAKQRFSAGANIDNEYVLLLYRYGVVGLITTVGFVWCLASQSRWTSHPQGSLPRALVLWTRVSLMSAAVFAYTAGVFMSFQLFGLLIVIWTVAARVGNDSAANPHSRLATPRLATSRRPLVSDVQKQRT